jgi:hypothetical protein
MPYARMDRWISQSAFTSPGRHAEYLAALGPAPEDVAAAIQGFLIHGEAVEQYGLGGARFSRETLPVEIRLNEILAADSRPLNVERAAADRAVGTCRDYAVLMCAAMRQQGRPARVRCGFAAYFSPGLWQDHWICEAWTDDRWRRIDAQLDSVTREALDVGFPPCDLPTDMYLTANEAWRECRSARVDPNLVGHEQHRGLWFAYVNLIRDRLAIADAITSAWDGWRATALTWPVLSPAMLAEGDQLAEQEPLEPQSFEPWWLSV